MPTSYNWTCCTNGDACNCGPVSGPISQGCYNSTQVSQCPPTVPEMRLCPGAAVPTSSCDGLNWASPPSSSGGCTHTGGCVGDGQCCPGQHCNIPAGSGTGTCG
jgi:hypothetical protein